MFRVLIILSLLIAFSAPAFSDEQAAATKPAAANAAPEIPLDQTNMEDAAVLAWTASAASDVMTFSATDYQQRLQQSARHFTGDGWEKFSAALKRSRIVDSVTAQNQTVSAQPEAAPVLAEKGPLNGTYRWIVTMPLTVTYKGATYARTDTWALRLVIERVASKGNPNGVGIAQWLVEAAPSTPVCCAGLKPVEADPVIGAGLNPPDATPLDRPNMDRTALRIWVAAAASDLFKFSYTDYETRLKHASRHFTKEGWDSLADWLSRARLLDDIAAQKMTVAAQPKEPPVLIQEGALNGKYRWVVTLPLTVNYKTAAGQRQDLLKLSLFVERASAAESPDGVLIAGFVEAGYAAGAQSSEKADAKTTDARDWLTGLRNAAGPEASPERRFMPDAPLDQPNMDKDSLLAWAASAAVRATTFGFDDFDEVFEKSKGNFTRDGWDGFYDMILPARKNVVQYQQLLSTIPASTPVLESERAKDGIYQWTVRFALVEATRAGSKKQTGYMPVTLTIVRVPTGQNPQGLAVADWSEAGNAGQAGKVNVSPLMLKLYHFWSVLTSGGQ